MGDVVRIMESELQMPSFMSFLHAFYVTSFVDKTDYNFNLTGFRMFDHDVSLTRQDKALGGTIKPDPKLVDQLISFAGPKGFLDYDDIARARRLRFHQSVMENPSLTFSVPERMWAIYEAMLLMEVVGHRGQLRADVAKDFLLNERLPLKWNAKGWDVGFYGWRAAVKFVELAWKTYTVDGWMPAEEAKKEKAHDEL
ncbi:hypothetical protein HDU96_000591 [Phlyctochytrium bullatum]|nr:hypothetical protein HDU96_000591 [Phlyctochytrium bullatum]